MKNLTIAESILNNTSEKKLNLACELAISADQNWEEESTIFTFEDDSQLKFSGSDQPVLIS